MPDDRPTTDDLSKALGWASLGLGTYQTLAPASFLRAIGARDTPGSRAVARYACGLRELGAAAGILELEEPRPVATLWARVAGDVLDLSLLAAALRGDPERPRRLVGALVTTAGITAVDVVAALDNARTRDTGEEVPAMQKQFAITVCCPASEAQERWRQLAIDADGPFRLAPVEILEEEPGRLLRWRATGAPAEGVLRFTSAPGDQGTELHLELTEDVGGVVGEAVQKLTGNEPFVQAKDDLSRFKQLVETGEIARSEGTPGGHDAPEHLHQRPAQPAEPSPVNA